MAFPRERCIPAPRGLSGARLASCAQERSRLLTELRETLFVGTDAHLEILEAGRRGEMPPRIAAAAAARCARGIHL